MQLSGKKIVPLQLWTSSIPICLSVDVNHVGKMNFLSRNIQALFCICLKVRSDEEVWELSEEKLPN